MQRSYKLTFPGVVFGAVTTVVFLATINSQANVLFFAMGLMVGAFFVSALFSTFMLRKVDVTRDVAGHAEVGQQLEVRYRLTSRNRIWPCFAVHISEHPANGFVPKSPQAYCLHLSARQSASASTHLVPIQRGELQLERIRLACSFPFGLVRRVVHHTQPATIVVYPRVGILERDIALRCRDALTDGVTASRARGGNDEFYGLREYRSGDNVKGIHWRRTARTGQVVVREMTHASPPRMVVALDLRSWREALDGANATERALELAASLVCHGMLQNYAVGLAIAGSTSDLTEPRTGRDTPDRMLRAIATLDLNKLTEPSTGTRVTGAEWMVITLRSQDTASDMLPAGAPSTRLPMDHPDAARWVRFDAPGSPNQPPEPSQIKNLTK